VLPDLVKHIHTQTIESTPSIEDMGFDCKKLLTEAYAKEEVKFNEFLIYCLGE